MQIDKPAQKYLDESGMLLIQVLLLSTILLALIYSGFSTVRTAIQSANTAATSATFQDFVLSIQQNLSLSANCFERIGSPSGGQANALINGNGVLPIKIYKSPGQVLHQVETAGTPPGSPDFKITELNLRAFKSLGRKRVAPFNNSIFTHQYSGVLAIAAERRSEFLGAKVMRAEIPLVLFQNAQGNSLFGCSVRSIYQVELGPPGGVRKSGLECIDRGGVPVMHATRNYYLCRIPISSLQTCGSIEETQWGSPNPEGWRCEFVEPTGADPNVARVAYAY